MLNRELEQGLRAPKQPTQPQVTKTAKRGHTGHTEAPPHASSVTDPHAKPWDTPGLPPRAPSERCKTHYTPPGRGRRGTGGVACAYRDDDPARCPLCHRRYGLPNGCGKSERCLGDDVA